MEQKVHQIKVKEILDNPMTSVQGLNSLDF